MNHSLAEQILIHFTDPLQQGKWLPLTDQIRGGKSTIEVRVDNDDTAVFSGNLTLLDGAGFASSRTRPVGSDSWNLEHEKNLMVEASGDGRTYKILLKDRTAEVSEQEYSWQAELLTCAEMVTRTIPLQDFKPFYRGRLIENLQPLDKTKIVEIGIQLNDKNPGPFQVRLKSMKAE